MHEMSHWLPEVEGQYGSPLLYSKVKVADGDKVSCCVRDGHNPLMECAQKEHTISCAHVHSFTHTCVCARTKAQHMQAHVWRHPSEMPAATPGWVES